MPDRVVIGAGSPCTVTVHPRDGGGVSITLDVPTYNGIAEFTLAAERSSDGDWLVFLPDAGPYDARGGIVYMGAPDVTRSATPDKDM